MSNNDYDPLFPWEGVVATHFHIDASRSDAENFVSIWISFNSWMKGQFGTRKTDRQLLNATKDYPPLNSAFERLKRQMHFSEALGSFSEYEVVKHKTSKNTGLTAHSDHY